MFPLTWLTALLVSCLQFLPTAAAITGDSGCGRYMCINATLNDGTITYQLTGLREPLGWLAIGFGRRMKDTHMVIVWSNSDGTTTLSQRFATGHHEPHPVTNPPRIATIDPSVASWHPSNKTSFAFTIPANTTYLASREPSERLIWAYSMTRPAKAPDSVLKPHYMAGFLDLDLTKPMANILETESQNEVTSDNSMTIGTSAVVHKRIIITHAIFLSIGFLVILPAGVLTARWTRTISPAWFKRHWILNMAYAVPVISIGSIAAPLAIWKRSGDHLVDQHEICGALLVVAYFIQVFLGRYIHARKQAQKVPAAKPHPPLNVLHIIVGLSVIGFAFFQVRSGFDEWEMATGGAPVPQWVRYLWASWAMIVLLSYAVGFSLLPRQFHQEAQRAISDRENYMSLPNDLPSADSRLLMEEDEVAEDKDQHI